MRRKLMIYNSPSIKHCTKKKQTKKTNKNSYADGNQGTSLGNEAQKCSD